jgi:hypothetical protein
MGIIATKGYKYRGVPKDLILILKDKSGYKNFIETGTYKGETSIWASSVFTEVTTIEASNAIFNTLKLKKFANISSLLGDSRDVLPKVIKGNSIFYLDAHNSEGSTFNSYPLLTELDIINGDPYDHIIIIDDARFCLSLYNGERYGDITDVCLKLGLKNRYVVVFDDMFIAVPIEFKKLIDNYTQNRSRIYFNRYLFEMKFKVFNRIFNSIILYLRKF